VPDSRTARPSLAAFDPAIHPELRALHELKPAWNWVCLLYPVLWVASIGVMERYPTPLVRTGGVVVIGISIQALAILMHEALHGNLFRHRVLDRWAAFAFGVPALFSGTAYRVAHLNHHRNTRTRQDQDEISNLVATPAQYQWLFYAWFALGTLLYFVIVPWKALQIAGGGRLRRRIVGEYAAMCLVYAAAMAIAMAAGRGDAVLWYWLLPATVAVVLSNVRGIAEHLGTGFGDAMTRTRTTRSNALVSFLMCNLNYHLEHHLFPGVPWYNLRKLHRLLLPLYAGAGVHVEPSYLRVAAHALRHGPFGEFQGRLLASKGLE